MGFLLTFIFLIGLTFAVIKTSNEPSVLTTIVENGSLDLPKNKTYSIKLTKDKLKILDASSFKTQLLAEYNISDIEEFDFKEEVQPDEVTEKDKSVLKRALVGGLLLGAPGAIVGGMSGIGTKKEVKKGKKDIYLLIKPNFSQALLFRVNMPTESLISLFLRKYSSVRKSVSITQAVSTSH